MIEVDLHVHTCCSDGKLTPQEIIIKANSVGIKYLSITDHDTTEAISDAIKFAKTIPEINIIPGIELSAEFENSELHILGYYIDFHSQSLENVLIEYREKRLLRAKLILKKLRSIGISISFGRLKEIAGKGSIGRPHIAKALVEKGYARNIGDAFYKFLSEKGQSFIPRDKPTVNTVINLIHSLGGVAVLAHPFWIDNLENTLSTLKKIGLDGIEVFYSNYNSDKIIKLKKFAERFNLIPCGGSDYHGLDDSRKLEIGMIGPPVSTIALLKKSKPFT
jgi:predicted metal-dependent phosphoesterase TrpH